MSFRHNSLDAKLYLKDYFTRSTPIIRQFFDQEILLAKKISPVSRDIIERFKKFMEKGKRLRGALIILGYEIFARQNKQAILKASTVIEIIHSFLLMHDDIIDQDDLRRGRPTVHKQYELLHRKHSYKYATAHYGASMAIVTGDLGMFSAQKLLASLPFSPLYVQRVIGFLGDLLIEVGHGEALDVEYESYKKLTEEDILRVHRYKTANYTISGPLIIGGLLAGKTLKELERVYKYGIPVGIAFQLRDDELGMFSSAEILGKPADSDLREGKNTILIVKALEGATPADRKFLLLAHGNKNLKKEDVEWARAIIRDTGAFSYSQKLSRKLVEEGKSHISKITSNPYYQNLLAKMADFMIERES